MPEPVNFSIKDLFLNKPECVINVPAQLLPPERIKALRVVPHLAIVEIAGRDSVAAAVKSAGEEGFTDIVPTYVYTGTEHGSWATVEQALERLKKKLPDIRVHELLILGSPRFWQTLNARFMSDLVSRYGFFTPCVGCHLYLHTVRIPLAITLGKAPIIAGERERHDQAVKVNQISEALDIYVSTARHFGIELLLPLRRIADGTRIRDILGFEWEAGKEQLECVLSANYRGWNGSEADTVHAVREYLQKFARPVTEKIIASYATGRIPNHIKIGADVLKGLRFSGQNAAYLRCPSVAANHASEKGREPQETG